MEWISRAYRGHEVGHLRQKRTRGGSTTDRGRDLTLDITSRDNDCGWRTIANELAEKVATLEGEINALKRQTFGQKSEKMTPIAVELRRQSTHNRVADAEKAKAKRIENAATRA